MFVAGVFSLAPGEWKSRNAYRDILSRFKCVSTAGVFRIDIYGISRLPRHAALHKMPADDGCSNLVDERKPAGKKETYEFAGAFGSMEKETLHSE